WIMPAALAMVTLTEFGWFASVAVVLSSAPAQRAYRRAKAWIDGFADDDTLKALEDADRIAFRYCDEAGAVTDDANPNGSRRGIAGIFNARKTVLGMMPHPERLVDAQLGGADGRPMFEHLVAALG
ncbi:MAG: phosphoribosylformylglycinamidine synthase subunit PurQ, partial [Rhodospirillaceae bacterium]